MLIGLIFIAAVAVILAGLACRNRRKVTKKATERSSSGAVWYPSKSGVSPIALLSKPFSEWTPSKSIAPTNDVWTTRKSAPPENDSAPSKYIAPTNDVVTPRKSISHNQAARDESCVIGFGFAANKSVRPLGVSSLGKAPLMPVKIESTKEETRVINSLRREPLPPGAVSPDTNEIAGHAESASEKIGRLEAEMQQYAEDTASTISKLSSRLSRNLGSNSKEEQETQVENM